MAHSETIELAAHAVVGSPERRGARLLSQRILLQCVHGQVDVLQHRRGSAGPVELNSAAAHRTHLEGRSGTGALKTFSTEKHVIIIRNLENMSYWNPHCTQ